MNNKSNGKSRLVFVFTGLCALHVLLAAFIGFFGNSYVSGPIVMLEYYQDHHQNDEESYRQLLNAEKNPDKLREIALRDHLISKREIGRVLDSYRVASNSIVPLTIFHACLSFIFAGLAQKFNKGGTP